VDLEPLGRTLLLLGAVLLAVGLLLTFAPQLPLLGKLPGDIRIERPGLRIYFPLATSLLISAVLSLLLHLFSKLR
jgi:hypothetical protein